MSIQLQSFDSPFETYNFLTYDLTTRKKIDQSYFKNKERLKKEIQLKVEKENNEIKVADQDLSSFILKADTKNKITGMVFVISDTENYRNSGYAIEVDFTWKEIKKYSSSSLLNLLN